MNDVATFFRERDKDGGETYQFQVDAPKGLYRVSVYARKPMQPAQFRNRQIVDKSEFALLVNDLRKAVGSEGAGGCIVTAVDEGSGRKLGVVNVKGDFDPANRFVLLSPGRPPVPLPAGDKNHKVPLGSHAIVPIDMTADESLGSFLGYLSWLPPDVESLLLHAIRRPSLDARLAKVETKLFGKSADDSSRGGWRTWFKEWRKPVVYRVAAAVALAMIVGALFLLRSQLSQLFAGTQTTSAAEVPPTGSNMSDTTGTHVVAEDPLIKEAKPLLEALRDKRAKSKDANFIAFYDSHFQELNQTLNDSQITALFEKDPKNRPFLWGLIKLQALNLRAHPADMTFLMSPQAITPTKTYFKDVIGMPLVRGTGLDLLAALSCRMAYETPKTPGLPSVPGSEELVFVSDRQCSDFNFNAEHITKGLPALTDVVKDLP